MYRIVLVTGLVLALAGPAVTPCMAADQLRDREQLQLQDRERVYGWELMNDQERLQFQERMRTARTEQEREQLRSENHERMQERARQLGVTLPDQPQQGRKGGGQGFGGGKGGGGR